MKNYKKVAVLDFSSGSVHIHELPASINTEEVLSELGYSLENIYWMDNVQYLSIHINIE